MTEKFTVSINPDGSIFLQGDEGSTMSVGGATNSTGNITSNIPTGVYNGSGAYAHNTMTTLLNRKKEEMEVIPHICEVEGGRWYCSDCNEWLDSEPEEWANLVAECYYEGPEDEFNPEVHIDKTVYNYLRGSCGCEFEDEDYNCFTHIEKGELIYSCPHCDAEWPDKDSAQECEYSCRLYG